MNTKKNISNIFGAGLLLFAILCLIPADVLADNNANGNSSRPISSRYTLEIGRAHQLSTYLSPIVYHGPEFNLTGDWRKKMPFNPDWEMEFQAELGLADTGNPAKNATMIKLDASFSWGMEYNWKFVSGLKIGAGGAMQVDGGILYLSRNSNNPVNAMARAGVNITGSLSCPFKLGSLTVTGFDQVSLPAIGLFFSPEYGETYYEIYLGNRRGLVNCGWWGNNFGLNNLLGAELHFGRRSLILGWRYELNTVHAHSLDTQLWRHSGVIGIKF